MVGTTLRVQPMIKGLCWQLTWVPVQLRSQRALRGDSEYVFRSYPSTATLRVSSGESAVHLRVRSAVDGSCRRPNVPTNRVDDLADVGVRGYEIGQAICETQALANRSNLRGGDTLLRHGGCDHLSH